MDGRFYKIRSMILQQRAELHGRGRWQLPHVKCSVHGTVGSLVSCPLVTLAGHPDEGRYSTRAPGYSMPETVSAEEFGLIEARLIGTVPPTCIKPAADFGPLTGQVKGPTTDVLWHSAFRLFMRAEAAERLSPYNLKGLRFAACSLAGTEETFVEVVPHETEALDRAGRRNATPCPECGQIPLNREPAPMNEFVQFATLPELDLMFPASGRTFIVSQRFVDAVEELWFTNWVVEPIRVVDG